MEVPTNTAELGRQLPEILRVILNRIAAAESELATIRRIQIEIRAKWDHPDLLSKYKG